MDRDELPIDRRTLLEVTSLLALSGTADGATDVRTTGTGVSGKDGYRITFRYGGAPKTVTTRRGRADVSSPPTVPSEHDDQGYGEHGYGGVVP